MHPAKAVEGHLEAHLPHREADVHHLPVNQRGWLFGESSESEAANLKTAYDLLRRCESVLRRREDKSVSILPAEEVEQRKVARWLGSETFESFQKEYSAARETIHGIYLRHIGT